jgi:hypothetical protein
LCPKSKPISPTKKENNKKRENYKEGKKMEKGIYPKNGFSYTAQVIRYAQK